MNTTTDTSIKVMQLRFFTIPVLGGGEAAAELNRFLAGHRILDERMAETVVLPSSRHGLPGPSARDGERSGCVDARPFAANPTQ